MNVLKRGLLIGLGVLAAGFGSGMPRGGCDAAQEMKMTDLEQRLEENVKLGIKAPEFPAGLDWLNVDRPLTARALRGKVALLDFWTFCCINCMHVIPELKRLEAKYPKELVVVGVHSAKFQNERLSENIRQSVLRYEVKHPVVNDSDMAIWRSYGASAWPTLMLIDAEGHLAMQISGEGHYELLDRAISFLIARAEEKGVLNRKPLAMALEAAREKDTPLRFPGKVFADADGLVISDSNHNQILVAGRDGTVRWRIGSGGAGNRDGNFETAEFNHPQGIFREGNRIYVADTENHLVREVDLEKQAVFRIAGTGAQGAFLHQPAPALTTALNSPWGLVKAGNALYITMAGAHQLWVLDLERKELKRFAGSGREGIVDGPPDMSALAQPSGITFDGERTFYFADSEVSSVRSADLATGRVETLIGAGLFDFGDQDGKWRSARLQHPLGVQFAEGRLYVADTYNDRIKVIDLEQETIRSIAGKGVGGFDDGIPGALYEPAGLSHWNGKLYIADTNNHLIRVLDLKSGALATLDIKTSGEPAVSGEALSQLDFGGGPGSQASPFRQTVALEPEVLKPGAVVSVSVLLPPDHEFTEGFPLAYQVQAGEGKTLAEGELKDPAEHLPLEFKVGSSVPEKATLEIEMNVPYCTTAEPKLCKFKSLKLFQPVSVSQDGAASLELTPQLQ